MMVRIKEVFSRLVKTTYDNNNLDRLSELIIQKFEEIAAKNFQVDTLALREQIEPIIVQLLTEYLDKSHHSYSKWEQNDISLESFLGDKLRTNCEALEELRWGTKLNLGPGTNWKRPGWTTVDCYKKCDVNIDFRKKEPFPFEDNTISIIFTSHMLEHMNNESGINIVNESYRVLKPGGILRVVVPDLEKALLAYEVKNIKWFLTNGMELTGNTVERLLVNFVASFALRHNKDGPISYSGGPVVEPDEVRSFLEKCDDAEEFIKWCVSKIPDDAPYLAHVNGFTAHKLEKWIKGTGFRHFVISGYRTSIIPELRLAGFDNHAAASLFVEGMK